MKDTLRWAYALNQWNFRLDVFVRHEDQQRALQTVFRAAASTTSSWPPGPVAGTTSAGRK